MALKRVWFFTCVLAAAGCGDGFSTDPALEPLAKVQGWRADLGPEGHPSAIIEIAYDRDTAERAWNDNVPDQIEENGSVGPGVYGDLDAVDFDQQAAIVWSSGESGSCPGWLANIRTERGQVIVETDHKVPRLSDACTADYRPYRMVLAVDRDRLPDPDELPIEDLDGVTDGLVDAYPARGDTDE